jgi:hypothetical protein
VLEDVLIDGSASAVASHLRAMAAVIAVGSNLVHAGKGFSTTAAAADG